jgi:hypothetical protein
MFANAGIKGRGALGAAIKARLRKVGTRQSGPACQVGSGHCIHHDAAIARNAADGQRQEHAERPIRTRPANSEIGTTTGIRSHLENFQFGQDIVEENLGTFETSTRARKRAQTYLRRKRLEAKA